MKNTFSKGARKRSFFLRALLFPLKVIGNLAAILGAVILLLFVGYSFGRMAGAGLLDALKDDKPAVHQSRPRPRLHAAPYRYAEKPARGSSA